MAGLKASLGPFDILDRFEFLAGYDSGYKAKPAPDKVHAFADQLDLAAREIMVVGDNLHDLDMGRSAGAGLVVGVLTGTSGHDELAPHADHVLEDITHLESVLA